MKILIAEDNVRLQKSVGMLLKCWGFDFDTASNGREAVEQAVANEGAYDLCLMDIDMPIMDGCEAAQTIRREVRYFPIMALSGNAYIEEKFAAAGMDDYLPKPFEADRLLGKIRELTVKAFDLFFDNFEFRIKKEMPMDPKQAEELRGLAKQGLCKMRLRGAGAHDVTVTVHKNIPNSIAYDFIQEEAELTTFIDRDKDSPAECYLFKSNCLVPAVLLDGEQYEEKCKKEDEKMQKRKELLTAKKET
ncbi:MAG: response regulator [Deltaproteobacteria bacterium]|nr:response regulator [Deltaproteobacteria bacterium]